MLIFEIPREQESVFIFYAIVYVALWNFSICTWSCNNASFDNSARFMLNWIIRSLCLSLFSVCLFVYLSVCLSVYSSMNLFISVCLCIHPSLLPSVRLSVLSVYVYITCVYIGVHLSMHVRIYVSIGLSEYLSNVARSVPYTSVRLKASQFPGFWNYLITHLLWHLERDFQPVSI